MTATSLIRIILYSLVPIGFWLLASPAYAALQISPAIQNLEITATSSNSATVRVTNQNDTAANLTFSLANVQATDAYGRLLFNAPLPQTLKPAVQEVATITPKSAAIKPNESTSIRITFDPKQLKAGGNNFIFLAEITPQSPSPTINNQRIRQYISSLILVTQRDGQHVQLSIADVEWPQIPVFISLPNQASFTIKNEGNTNAVPYGIARVIDQFGREIARGPVNNKSITVFPGSQRIITSPIAPTHKKFPITLGKLVITTYDQQKISQLSITKTFLYINPWLGLIIPTAALGLLLYRRLRK